MANRVFYAVHALGISKDGNHSYIAAHGVQSVGITTTFNLEQVFELGQISLYDNIEGIPDIELTAEKVLDGYPLLYHLATNGSSSATLAGRSAVACNVALTIHDDSKDAASGTPVSEIRMSGMVVSNLTYTFPVEGSCTEAVTLIGQNKVWNTSAPFTFSGGFTNTDVPQAGSASGNVNQRKDVLFTVSAGGLPLDVNGQVADPNSTILPGGTNGIPGIASSGLNVRTGGVYGAHIQTITVSTDLNREALLELGRRAPYFRFVNFPVQVTCDIDVLTTTGDRVDATEGGALGGGSNLSNKTIRVATLEGTRLNLGTKNKLQSVTYTGGDATGGNVITTFSYSNFNDLTVTHCAYPTIALAPAQGGIANPA